MLPQHREGGDNKPVEEKSHRDHVQQQGPTELQGCGSTPSPRAAPLLHPRLVFLLLTYSGAVARRYHDNFSSSLHYLAHERDTAEMNHVLR